MMCLSETWLKSNAAQLLETEGFKSYHTFTSHGYGGVAIYVKNNFPSTLSKESYVSTGSIELCTIKVTSSCKSYRFFFNVPFP